MKRKVLSIALAVLLSCSLVSAQTQTPAQIVQQIKTLLDQLVPPVPVPPPPPVTGPSIATPEAFDVALATASPGAVLSLDPALTYTKALTLSKSVTLQSIAKNVGRMTLTSPAPKFTGGIAITGPSVSLIGLEVTNVTDPQKTLVAVTGDHFQLLQNRILGSKTVGARRGIEANGADGVVRGNYVEDCFRPSPGDDSQAIVAWDTPGPLLIEDNYLSGGSETVLIGGADPQSIDRIPTNVTIRGNTITKRPEWQGQKIGVKNALELKNCKKCIVESNTVSYSWASGQTGYLLMLTVRNQNGKAPWSTIEDVEIDHNTWTHGAAAINILGSDDNHPSGMLTRVNIHDEVFTDLDVVKYSTPSAGSKQMIQIGAGTIDLTINNCTFAAVGHTADVYFYGAINTRLKITNNTWPKTKYGIFGANVSVGKAWALFTTPDSVVAANIETP